MTDAPTNIDDHALVQRCRHGDSEAMQLLIVKYQRRIYNVILKICINHHDAAELAQDTFVKVIENIDKFQGKSSFYTWAFRIAINLTLNYCKKNVRIGLRSIDAEPDRQTDKGVQSLKEFLCDESSPDPAAVTQNKELQEIAMRALNQLDDAQKTVIVLRELEGMSYAQIAEVLDIELGTVRSRLSRARSNLREILEAILQ